MGPPADIAGMAQALAGAGYLASREIATAAFLADRLEKPILVEGPAGVGKTELGRSLAAALGRELLRLQCYEGLDEAKALYEWEYAKQLLYSQLLKEKIGEVLASASTLSEAVERIEHSDAIFFSERFLLPRPVLKAITARVPCLLLIDEIDKADPEFEAFLLEVLSENAVTIPELGTVRARIAPRVVLTSNNTRELSDALKRRCLHLFIDFPSPERELAIVRARAPQVREALAESVVAAIQKIRSLDLKKTPSISETLDWAKGLALLNADALTPELVSETLNLVLKYEGDIARARERAAEIASASEASINSSPP
jgi:MoxR-like ATPase